MVHYIVEASVIGLLTSVIGTLLSVLSMYQQPGFTLKQIHFWPSLFITGFMTGFIIHVIAELSGLNKWYCKNGYACMRNK